MNELVSDSRSNLDNTNELFQNFIHLCTRMVFISYLRIVENLCTWLQACYTKWTNNFHAFHMILILNTQQPLVMDLLLLIQCWHNGYSHYFLMWSLIARYLLSIDIPIILKIYNLVPMILLNGSCNWINNP